MRVCCGTGPVVCCMLLWELLGQGGSGGGCRWCWFRGGEVCSHDRIASMGGCAGASAAPFEEPPDRHMPRCELSAGWLVKCPVSLARPRS